MEIAKISKRITNNIYETDNLKAVEDLSESMTPMPLSASQRRDFARRYAAEFSVYSIRL